MRGEAARGEAVRGEGVRGEGVRGRGSGREKVKLTLIFISSVAKHAGLCSSTCV